MNKFNVLCNAGCGCAEIIAEYTQVNNNTNFGFFQYFCAQCGQPSIVDDVLKDKIPRQLYLEQYKAAFAPPLSDEDLEKKIIEAANLQVYNAILAHQNKNHR